MSAVMSEETKQLFLIFKNAIQSERQMQGEYKEAADLCDDPSLKSVLMAFCQDEARHEQVLLERYALLQKQYNILD